MFVYLDIVEGFSCQQCGACCRNNWLVTVDEAGYRRNRELFQATGREDEFLQAFVPLLEEADYGEYAKIAKRTGGGCWFLTPENLCRLQQIAGHEHLDAVCQWFPRYPMDTERGIELSLSFSCPAAVKLALREQPLRIVRSDESPIPRLPLDFVNHVYPSQQPEHSALRYYFEIEQHLIDLLQQRQLALAERLSMTRRFLMALERLADPEKMGSEINCLVQSDYDRIDAKTAAGGADRGGPVQWLIENYFVNFIFRKSLYSNGFAKTLQRLELMQRRLERFLQENVACDENAVARVILQLELEYNHNSRAK